jgi:glycosyltransferase involved in cell wall biosynthesis
VRSLARWAVHGEHNVRSTLERLHTDVAELHVRTDQLAAGLHAPMSSGDFGAAVPAQREPWLSPPVLGSGVNVIGYLQHQVGLGNVARRLATLLADEGVPTSPIAFDGTHAPLTTEAFISPQRLDHANTVAVLAADQLAVLRSWYPQVFERTFTAGYCFWELAELPPEQIAGARCADEIWVATTFTAQAFEAVDGISVRRVPIPIAEPAPSDRSRQSFGPLASAGDRVVFGVTFDHFSSLERKNPIGAIDAFCRAFPDNGQYLMVVKTLNAAHHPAAHDLLTERAALRSDIVVWDEHLTRADQLAFIAQLDVLVSLHRGEGLGLHLAEAMWLGVPVIATGYSGNLDFMDDESAGLVRHTLIEVGDQALHYPAAAWWADPDLDHAAELMRRFVDPARSSAVVAAARARMVAQRSDADTAAQVIALFTRVA